VNATVSFFGYFRDIVKEGRVQVTLPSGTTLRDVIEVLTERYGPRVRERLLREDGTLLSGVRVALGNDFVEDLSLRLGQEEPQVDIYVMHDMAGGSPVEDVWVDTACALCYSYCGIRAHRVDGVVIKIEGNPDDPATNGRICPKGLAGLMLLYDPNRVNVPMKRRSQGEPHSSKSAAWNARWADDHFNAPVRVVASDASLVRSRRASHAAVRRWTHSSPAAAIDRSRATTSSSSRSM